MRYIKLTFGILLFSAFLLAGCGSNSVKNIDDVNIIGDSMEDLALDNGIDKVDSDLIDFGDLDESSLDETASELGLEEADTDLIEFGEMI